MNLIATATCKAYICLPMYEVDCFFQIIFFMVKYNHDLTYCHLWIVIGHLSQGASKVLEVKLFNFQIYLVK